MFTNNLLEQSELCLLSLVRTKIASHIWIDVHFRRVSSLGEHRAASSTFPNGMSRRPILLVLASEFSLASSDIRLVLLLLCDLLPYT
jgi:hypothetical protein